jgi:hypothetical protein
MPRQGVLWAWKINWALYLLADLGTGEDVPGGPYVNVWSGTGAALEKNQAMANLLGRIAQQVKATTGNVALVGAKAS